MAPKFLKKIGRGLRKFYCIKVSDEDRQDPAYGVAEEYATEYPKESPKVLSAKKELSPKESLDFAENHELPSPTKELFSPEILDPTETIKIPSPKLKLKRSDYQLITLYKADDPAFEQYSGYDADISEDEDDIMSSSSSEYFTAEEDNTSSGSLMSDSEVDALESEMTQIFMDMQQLSRRLRQIPGDQNRTMKSDVGRFRRKFMNTDSKIKKMFY